MERPDFGVLSVLDIDLSLVRGDGGMTVTLGLMDSVSVSPRWLVSESDGRWVLGLDMEIVGCLGDVGDGDGERVASRWCPPGFTSFEKKLGGMPAWTGRPG